MSQPYQAKKKIKSSAGGVWLRLALILVFLIIGSAFSTVYIKDLYRRDLIVYQKCLQKTRHLDAEYGRLLLEESAWARSERIQSLASESLNMHLPSVKKVRVIVLGGGVDGGASKKNIK